MVRWDFSDLLCNLYGFRGVVYDQTGEGIKGQKDFSSNAHKFHF